MATTTDLIALTIIMLPVYMIIIGVIWYYIKEKKNEI